MGTPAEYFLTVDQASTFRLSVTWTDPNGTPINLTGFRVLFQLRSLIDHNSPELRFDSAALLSGQHIGTLGSSGQIDITIDDELTAPLAPGMSAWDLLVESSVGVRDKLVYGPVFVRETVTRIP